MVETVTALGMVISSMAIGEYDKRLVIITKEFGKITAFARGARKPNSPFLGGSQPMAFGEFTLYADCKKGNRPSFVKAGAPDMAEHLYEHFMERCRNYVDVVEKGQFGADMKVELLNDGPFTLMLESEQLFK